MLSWKAAVAAVIASVGFHAFNDFRPLDSYLPSPTPNAAVDQHFSETYYQARALFRQRVKDTTDATLHTLPVEGLTQWDLTIDVAVLPGASASVILHISGTHGVEGFTGSAIQSAILQQRSLERHNCKGPTVVLVHALNPFGFANLRRVNEHNVDLNRNWLSPDEFAAALAENPNANGYADVYDILNPQPLGTLWTKITRYAKSLGTLSVVGFGNLKKTMVAATYYFSKGIFYGGTEKQPSLVALERFLKQEIGAGNLKALAIVDVHTGLGPAGMDTIILTPKHDTASALRIFDEENRAGFVASDQSGGTAVTEGYAATKGYVVAGIAQLVREELRANVLTVTQEFGTVPMVFVGKAMIDENAFYHHAPSRRLPYAEKLRDIFYVHMSPSWKQSVINRGLSVFKKLYAHASSLNTGTK